MAHIFTVVSVFALWLNHHHSGNFSLSNQNEVFVIVRPEVFRKDAALWVEYCPSDENFFELFFELTIVSFLVSNIFWIPDIPTQLIAPTPPNSKIWMPFSCSHEVKIGWRLKCNLHDQRSIDLRLKFQHTAIWNVLLADMHLLLRRLSSNRDRISFQSKWPTVESFSAGVLNVLDRLSIGTSQSLIYQIAKEQFHLISPHSANYSEKVR